MSLSVPSWSCHFCQHMLCIHTCVPRGQRIAYELRTHCVLVPYSAYEERMSCVCIAYSYRMSCVLSTQHVRTIVWSYPKLSCAQCVPLPNAAYVFRMSSVWVAYELRTVRMHCVLSTQLIRNTIRICVTGALGRLEFSNSVNSNGKQNKQPNVVVVDMMML